MFNLQSYNQAKKKIKKDCTVRCAKIACMVYLNGRHTFPTYVTVNKRGTGGKCSPWSYHAEELAIERLSRSDVWNFPVFVVLRLRADGTVGCAKPCEKCSYLLLHSKKLVRTEVYYSNADGTFSRLW
jgi:hypothetical protein